MAAAEMRIWLEVLVLAASLACQSKITRVGGSSSGSTGGLGAGSPCTSNAECLSRICGLDGGGNCCNTACPATDPACGASGCDATGACLYAPPGASCATCRAGTLEPAACNGSGACITGISRACPGNFACDMSGDMRATNCKTTCATQTDCASGFYCASGACLPQAATGSCTTNDACNSGVCGIAGTGHCCTAACATASPCGAADCDFRTGACLYPVSGVACGSTPESCSAGVQQNPSVCDGMGHCPTPGTTQCAPYACGTNACLASCSDGTSCAVGDFCDAVNSTCCTGLASGGQLAVDSATGNDDLACCGIGPNGPCRTLTHAMALIDAAQARDVTVHASVDGAGGDWLPGRAEGFPVALGWGVELSAPGVYFQDQTGAGKLAIFDVGFASQADTVGYASLVGAASASVGVGMNQANTEQSQEDSAILIEAGNTLYIANAVVNGSASGRTNSITVAAGGVLTLGQDQPDQVTGTVQVGNALHQSATDGYNGIYCETDNQSLGCTIRDADLAGQSSLIMQGQEGEDIFVQNFGDVSLTSAPVIGIPPVGVGFDACPAIADGYSIELYGQSTVTLSNATIQCSRSGVYLSGPIDSSGGVMDTGEGPTVDIDHTLIQHTEQAIYVALGRATVSNSTIQFNYYGVTQAEGTLSNPAVLDLSGGARGGTNTIICSSNQEGPSPPNEAEPGLNVVNYSETQTLNASNVAWDTPGPDQFSCQINVSSCSCASSSCVVKPGGDGMDAVTEAFAASILTTDNTVSPTAVAYGCQ